MSDLGEEFKSETDMGFGTLTNIMILASPEQLSELNDGIYLIPDKLRIRNPTESVQNHINSFRTIAKIPQPPFSKGMNFILLELFEDGIEEVLNDAYNLIERALLAFRLYKTGPIYIQELYKFNRGIDISLHSFFQPVYSDYIYDIKYDELDFIKNIIQDLQLIDFEEIPAIRIACDRFSKSYQEHYTLDKLIDYCICFEALFTGGRNIRPKGEAIGITCSMLLGKDREERENIFKDIKNAFRDRNDIMHGKKINHDQLLKIKISLHSLEKHLRRSILRLIF